MAQCTHEKDTLADGPFILLPNFDIFLLLTYQLGIEIAKKNHVQKSPIRTHEAILNCSFQGFTANFD